MEKGAVKLEEVCKSFCTDYVELKVLDNITYELAKGKILAIIGPSGCGKSTILNIISGLEKHNSGEVYVDGKIGYMFQKDNLFEFRNVYQNIILALEIKKMSKDKERIKEVNRLCDTYGLTDFLKVKPSKLSGGMRQRVALIRTLATSPDILLLDEPFGALDYQTKLEVIDDIYKIIRKENITAILVTHDISEAISIADEIIVLSKRPSRIKNVHKVKLSLGKNKTPYEARKALEFKDYYDMIWRELTSNK